MALNNDESLPAEGEGSGGEDDSMLLHPGIRRPPYKASVAQAIKDSWKPHRSRGRNKRPLIVMTRGCTCGVVIFIITVVVIAIALGYTVGFLVGSNLNNSSKNSECSKPNSEGTKKPPSLSSIEMVSLQQQLDHVMLNEEKYNWGDEVAVNGSSTKVAELFKSMLDEKAIRDNLE